MSVASWSEHDTGVRGRSCVQTQVGAQLQGQPRLPAPARDQGLLRWPECARVPGNCTALSGRGEPLKRAKPSRPWPDAMTRYRRVQRGFVTSGAEQRGERGLVYGQKNVVQRTLS